MLAFRETKFSRSCRQSYTRLRNGRWLISRSRRLRLSRCWKRRTDYQQNFKAKSRSLTVIRKRRGLVRDDTVTQDRWIPRWPRTAPRAKAQIVHLSVSRG